MGLESACRADIHDVQIAASAGCMNFKMTVRRVGGGFGPEVQLTAPMVCPQAAAPPSGASPERVSDRVEQLDVSARSSPHQMAHRQGPAEKRCASALACGGR